MSAEPDLYGLLVELSEKVGGLTVTCERTLAEAQRTNGRLSRHDREIDEIKQELAVDKANAHQVERTRAKWSGRATTVASVVSAFALVVSIVVAVAHV